MAMKQCAGGAGAPGLDPLRPPPPPPHSSGNLVRECRTRGAEDALSKICVMWQRVTKWVFTPCVYTQNTQIFQENSILEENHI